MTTGGGRLLCVGDIHGCLPELRRLIDGLGLTGADRIVFLGDYIDRGDASAQTLDLLLEVRAAPPSTTTPRRLRLEMLGRGSPVVSVRVAPH